MWEIPPQPGTCLSLQEPRNEQLIQVSPNSGLTLNPAVGIHLWLLLEMGHWLHEPLLWPHTALYLYQNLPVQSMSVCRGSCKHPAGSVSWCAACFQLQWQFKDVWHRRSPSASAIRDSPLCSWLDAGSHFSAFSSAWNLPSSPFSFKM